MTKIKIGCLLGLMLFLFSCEKDDLEIEKEDPEIKKEDQKIIYGKDLVLLDSEVEQYLTLDSEAKRLNYKVIIKPKNSTYKNLKVNVLSKENLTNKPTIRNARGNSFPFQAEIDLNINSDIENKPQFYFEIVDISDQVIDQLKNQEISIASLYEYFTFNNKKEFTLDYVTNDTAYEGNITEGRNFLSYFDFNHEINWISEPLLVSPFPESLNPNNEKEPLYLGLDKNKAKILLGEVDRFNFSETKKDLNGFIGIYKKIQSGTTLGLVFPLENYEKWILGLNYFHFFDNQNIAYQDNLKEKKNSYEHTVVHELAHIYTLRKRNVNDEIESCETYQVFDKCINSASLIGQFYAKFWKESNQDAKYNSDDFVTRYAATNVNEDIAETITYYLRLKELPLDEQKYTALKHQKLRFLNENSPELREIRDSKSISIDETLHVEVNSFLTGQNGFLSSSLMRKAIDDHQGCLPTKGMQKIHLKE